MTYLLMYEIGSGWAFTSLTLDWTTKVRKNYKKKQKKNTPILSTIFENACHVGKTLGQLSAFVLFWLRLGKGNPKLSTMLDPVCQRHISHKALKSHSSLSTQVLYAFFFFFNHLYFPRGSANHAAPSESAYSAAFYFICFKQKTSWEQRNETEGGTWSSFQPKLGIWSKLNV